MALGSSQVTVSTAICFIPEIWAQEVITQAEANLVIRKLVWDLSENGKRYGDTINVPNVTDFTSTAKSANTVLTLSTNTETSVNLSINRHDYVAFLIEDIVKVQASYNLSKHLLGKAAYGVTKQMDTRLSTLFGSFSQITGEAGVDLGDEQVRFAIEKLLIADADTKEPWSFVMYPDQMTAIMGIEKYFRADIQGNGASEILTKGKFGHIYNLNTYVTTNLSTSGTPAARLNAIFHREALASAIQQDPRTKISDIHEYLGTLFSVDAIYGEIETRDTFGVWLKS